jgi:hypothetical protein
MFLPLSSLFIESSKGEFPMLRLRSLLFAATLSAAALGTGAAQAQQYYPPGPPPPGYGHPWHHGDRFYGPRHVVHHWWKYGLSRPPYGYVWVEAGPRFLLVGPDGVIDRVWGG